MHWAVYSRPSSPSILPRRRLWKFRLAHVEIHVLTIHSFYVKSNVMAVVRSPFSQKSDRPGSAVQWNSNQCFGNWVPCRQEGVVRASLDDVEGRKGYSGFYQFGASYNAGKFTSLASATPRSGNYLLYWMANQALWRLDPKEGKGLDATFAYDWSSPSVNRNNTMLTAGLRFSEPLPVCIHNTRSLGYVRHRLSPQFLPTGSPA
jgi:porin